MARDTASGTVLKDIRSPVAVLIEAVDRESLEVAMRTTRQFVVFLDTALPGLHGIEASPMCDA